MTSLDVRKLHGMRLSNGRYELIRPAANETNMSIVYEAYDHRTSRTVAIKFLLPGTSPTLRQRFEREAILAYNLNHQNVVSTKDYNLDDSHDHGLIYLVMRWLPGKTLDIVIRERDDDAVVSSQLLEEACQLLTKIGGALDYIHEQHIIHRDIKPHNIMWLDGEPYLLDFGIAKKLQASKNVSPDATQVDDDESLSDGLTRLGTVTPGTPRYMSPEQILSERLDGRSDQYSMALVIYEYLVGAGGSPYTITGASTQRTEWQSKHVREKPRPVTAFRPDIPAAVSEVLNKALAKRPDERYPTLGAFAQAFCQAAKPSQPRSAILANLPLPLPLLGGMVIAVLIGFALVVLAQNSGNSDGNTDGTAAVVLNTSQLTIPLLVTLMPSDTPTLLSLSEEQTATQQSIDATRIAAIVTETARAQTLAAAAELTFVAQTPSVTPTPTPTPTFTATLTPTASLTFTATLSATVTPQPTATPLLPTVPITSTATAVPTVTATVPTPILTRAIDTTATIDAGPQVTLTDTPTHRPAATSTFTPVLPTASLQPTNRPTGTSTPTASLQPTDRPTGTSTPTEELTSLLIMSSTPAVTATPSPCQRADLNGDGIVDEKDLALLEAALDTAIGDDLYSTHYDLNLDGRINSQDYSIIFSLLGVECIPLSVLSECQLADVNGDGIIDQADLLILDDLLGLTVSEALYRNEADVNRDGIINAIDQRLIIVRLGQICTEVDALEVAPVLPDAPDLCVQADLNQDGIVDEVDLEVIDNLFGAQIGDADYNLMVDLNADGTIDSRDQQILLERMVICDQ